ncbi:MAG: hypothetical protein HY586_04695, partial [Candidatus Omnitrophica bacterium]|nr:hypothetical protein [Candidatus Omnitrophota bacterium]
MILLKLGMGVDPFASTRINTFKKSLAGGIMRMPNFVLKLVVYLVVAVFSFNQIIFAQAVSGNSGSPSRGQTPVQSANAFSTQNTQSGTVNSPSWSIQNPSTTQTFLSQNSPLVPSQASLTPATLSKSTDQNNDRYSSLPATGMLSVISEPGSAETKIKKRSQNRISVDYSVDKNTASAKTGFEIIYDNPDTLLVEYANWAATGTIRLGIEAHESMNVYFEVEDTFGNRGSVYLARQHADSNQEIMYDINLSLIPASVDLERVRKVSLAGMSAAGSEGRGQIEVRLGGLALMPVALSTYRNFNSRKIRPGKYFHSDMVGAFTGPAAGYTLALDKRESSRNAVLTVTGSNSAVVSFRSSGSGRKEAGLLWNYDNPATRTVESANFSANDTLMFALDGKLNKAELQIKDKRGRELSVSFQDVSNGQYSFYQLDISELSRKINLSEILEIRLFLVTQSARRGRNIGPIKILFGFFAEDHTPPVVTQASSDISAAANYLLQLNVDGKNYSETVALLQEGANIIERQFADPFGNWTVWQDTVVRDTTPPIGSVAINSGNDYTISRDINLTLTAQDALSDVDAMRFSFDGIYWTAWEAFQTSKQLMLSSADGTKEIWYEVRDHFGHSAIFSASIVLDTVPPDIQILSSGVPTNRSNYTVEYAVDGVVKTTTRTLVEGLNTVIVAESDPAGNRGMASFDVTLDTQPPVGTIVINENAAYATNPIITLDVTSQDNTSGVRRIRFSRDGGVT